MLNNYLWRPHRIVCVIFILSIVDVSYLPWQYFHISHIKVADIEELFLQLALRRKTWRLSYTRRTLKEHIIASLLLLYKQLVLKIIISFYLRPKVSLVDSILFKNYFYLCELISMFNSIYCCVQPRIWWQELLAIFLWSIGFNLFITKYINLYLMYSLKSTDGNLLWHYMKLDRMYF